MSGSHSVGAWEGPSAVLEAVIEERNPGLSENQALVVHFVESHLLTNSSAICVVPICLLVKEGIKLSVLLNEAPGHVGVWGSGDIVPEN
jgi:hypothetical protein